MNNEQMITAFKNWYRVKIIGIDFSGIIVSVFQTRLKPAPRCKRDTLTNRREILCVIEDDFKNFKIVPADFLDLDDSEIQKQEKIKEIRNRPFHHPEIFRNGVGLRIDRRKQEKEKEKEKQK